MVHFAGEQATSLTQSADADNSTYAGAEQAAADITPPVVGQRASAGFAAAAELDRLGDSIAELAAHLHAATYRLLVMLAEFDRRGGWGGGFRSCAHWLSWRTRINLGAAREKVRVARAHSTGSRQRVSRRARTSPRTRSNRRTRSASSRSGRSAADRCRLISRRP